jgi:nucleotide-binding universal stress UspA family protein
MYRNILVPHAGSSAGDEALQHAVAMAKDNHAKITVLHVVENMPIPLSLEYSERKKITESLNQIRSEMKREMRKQLDAKAAELGKSGIEIDTVVVHGYPDDEIVRISAAEKCDLIVMAKRRKLTGIMGVLKLGSVSRKIIERVSCPILLIDGESA